MDWKDAIEFMIVGASAVQIGTVNFINPNAGVEIISGMEEFCKQESINKISDLTASYLI